MSNNFKWAHSDKANIKEPLPELKEKGWQFADVPTASNFNWIFKTIAEELSAIRQRMDAQDAKLEALEQKITTNHTKARLGIKFNEGITHQICAQLINFNKQVSHFHPNIQHHPWPFADQNLGERSPEELKRDWEKLRHEYYNHFRDDTEAA